MMAKLMRWRPWPPVITKKFKVNLRVQSLEGLSEEVSSRIGEDDVMIIKVEWRGSKGTLGYNFRRGQKRARTSEKGLQEGSSINWHEDFEHLCGLAIAKRSGRFLPFYMHFSFIQLGTKSRSIMLGTTRMNLADFAPLTQDGPTEHTTRLNMSNPELSQKQVATLVVTISFAEVLPIEDLTLARSTQQPSLPCLTSPFSCDQKIRGMYEKKVKDIRKTVSLNWKKTSRELDIFTCSGKLFPTSEKFSSESEASSNDTDSIDGSESVRVVDEGNQLLQTYGSLAGVNLVVEGALPTLPETRQEPPVVPTGKDPRPADIDEAASSEADSSTHMLNLLSWKKRKFRAREDRGEPLLSRSQSEGGGDDIDHYRRLSSYYLHGKSQEGGSGMLSSAALSECLDCGEVQFSVGCWENKEFINRVGHMKLSTKVFFASIDQRSERADGESACTALVVVIADWLHKNPDRMPIRAELDTLIRQGAAEWRQLCKVEMYRKRFPDGHFDLDTVLEAQVRPVGIREGGTSVGFFKPEENNKMFEFLQDTVSFDDIWESLIIEESSVSNPDRSFKPAVYIVSWNDHFFLLKVDRDAYYIIDTLGERLYEGCKRAYMLCFDKETSLSHQTESDREVDGKKSPIKSPIKTPPTSPLSAASVPAALTATQSPDIITSTSNQQQQLGAAQGDIDPQEDEINRINYSGRDACKEFIKGFFAALPLKQLQMDIKKGLLGKSLPHHRLQIEFHRTYSSDIVSPLLVQETIPPLQHSTSSVANETNTALHHPWPFKGPVNNYPLRRTITA